MLWLTYFRSIPHLPDDYIRRLMQGLIPHFGYIWEEPIWLPKGQWPPPRKRTKPRMPWQRVTKAGLRREAALRARGLDPHRMDEHGNYKPLDPNAKVEAQAVPVSATEMFNPPAPPTPQQAKKHPKRGWCKGEWA